MTLRQKNTWRNVSWAAREVILVKTTVSWSTNLASFPGSFPLTARAWVWGYTTIKQGAQRIYLFWLVCACLTYIIKIIISCYLGLCGRAYFCSCTSSWSLCSSPMLKDYTRPESMCTGTCNYNVYLISCSKQDTSIWLCMDYGVGMQ